MKKSKHKEMTILEKKSSKRSLEQLEGKIKLGDFYEVEKETYYDTYTKNIDIARENFTK